jgi:hypothetical protein
MVRENCTRGGFVTFHKDVEPILRETPDAIAPV